MGISLSSGQDVFAEELSGMTPVGLIERGLEYIRKGHYANGWAFFALARERLAAGQVELGVALEGLNRVTLEYWRAREALHEASRRFVETDAEQQAQITALEKLLCGLVREGDEGVTQGRSDGQRQRPLQLLRPAREIVEEDEQGLPALYVTCFGCFGVRRTDVGERALELCRNAKGQAILRYLVAQAGKRETMDKLMAVLWAEEAPDVARHKMRVAVSALRCALNRGLRCETGGGYIQYRGQVYQIHAEARVQTDVDEFVALYQAGQQAQGRASAEDASMSYERACNLYSGPFLVEDMYADWSMLRREQLRKMYVGMCEQLAKGGLASGDYEAVGRWSMAILREDRCDEEAHRLLMRAYAEQGRRSEALRQYQQCQAVLGEELGVQPMPETQKLLYWVLHREERP